VSLEHVDHPFPRWRWSLQRSLPRKGDQNFRKRRDQNLRNPHLTLDANLEYQQRLGGMPFGVAVLHAPSSRMHDLRTLVPVLLAALEDLTPGAVRHIRP